MTSRSRSSRRPATIRRRRPRAGGPRPRRGTPAETRARLVATAAAVFNRSGYHGTDSNRLARTAGYAPATFYKHFPHKRAIFLAAYEAWVTAEWEAIEAILRQGGRPPRLAARIVEQVLALHRHWRGLRASLRALVAQDPEARAFYRKQRRRQLKMLAALRSSTVAAARGREEDAILLFTLERVCDAVADDEVRDLGLNVTRTVTLLRSLVRRSLA
jgi:AcrR family transcriptional regulator